MSSWWKNNVANNGLNWGPDSLPLTPLAFLGKRLKVAMVIAAMSALAMDSMAHIVGEGPLINAEKVLSGGVGSITFYAS